MTKKRFDVKCHPNFNKKAPKKATASKMHNYHVRKSFLIAPMTDLNIKVKRPQLRKHKNIARANSTSLSESI